METVRPKVKILLDELIASLNAILGESIPQFDWSIWNQNVQNLRQDLLNQLEACRGKFTGGVSSVGEYASNEEISNAVQHLKQEIGF